MVLMTPRGTRLQNKTLEAAAAAKELDNLDARGSLICLGCRGVACKFRKLKARKMADACEQCKMWVCAACLIKGVNTQPCSKEAMKDHVLMCKSVDLRQDWPTVKKAYLRAIGGEISGEATDEERTTRMQAMRLVDADFVLNLMDLKVPARRAIALPTGDQELGGA